MAVDERRFKMKSLGLCYNWLGHGHIMVNSKWWWYDPVLGTSANRSASPEIRKLRTQGFGLRICEPISYRKHLWICGKKIKIYRKSANQQHLWDRFCNFQKNNMFLRFNVSTDLGG